MPSHSSCSSLARFDIWIGEKWPTLTVSEPPTGAKALASLAANPMQFSPVLTCSLTQRHGSVPGYHSSRTSQPSVGCACSDGPGDCRLGSEPIWRTKSSRPYQKLISRKPFDLCTSTQQYKTLWRNSVSISDSATATCFFFFLFSFLDIHQSICLALKPFNLKMVLRSLFGVKWDIVTCCILHGEGVFVSWPMASPLRDLTAQKGLLATQDP